MEEVKSEKKEEISQTPTAEKILTPQKFKFRFNIKLFLIALFVILVVGLLLGIKYLSTKEAKPQANSAVVSLPNEKEINSLLDNLPTEFKDTKWEKIKKDTELYIYPGGEADNQTVPGYSRTGTVTLSLEQAQKIKKVEEHYLSIASGWEEANFYNDYTYLKQDGGGQISILKIRVFSGDDLTYTETSKKCPCTYTFKIFYSLPMSDVPPTPTPTPTIEVFNGELGQIPDSFQTKAFVKRQIDVNGKFFDNFDYPSVVKEVSDSQLVGMECSAAVRWNGKNFELWSYSNSEDSSSYISPTPSNDVFYRQLRYKLFQIGQASPVGENLGFNYCKSENGDQFIENTEGGAVSWGIIDKDGNIKEVATSDANLTFMYCSYPIELKSNGELIYSCKGGDTRGHGVIVGVNFNDKTIKYYYSCSTGGPGVVVEPSTCEVPTD